MREGDGAPRTKVTGDGRIGEGKSMTIHFLCLICDLYDLQRAFRTKSTLRIMVNCRYKQ